MAPEAGVRGHSRPSAKPAAYKPAGARADDWALQHPLDCDEKIDIEQILDGLESYRPRRRGWTWRRPEKDAKVGPFSYREISQKLTRSIPLPAAKYFGNIDPQPDCVITTEIASGRFEDDIRRMRMAAWHGADHIMVIRTAGQSHMDSLLEGTPEGVGGIAVTRKQCRATRKALDLIEDVGVTAPPPPFSPADGSRPGTPERLW